MTRICAAVLAVVENSIFGHVSITVVLIGEDLGNAIDSSLVVNMSGKYANQKRLIAIT